MRKTNWPQLLQDFIESRRDEPFVFGSNDCFKFALDWFELVTGNQVKCPSYSDHKSMVEVQKEIGGIVSFADNHFGERIGPIYAQTGDIVSVNKDSRQGLGVVVGSGYMAGPGKENIVFELMSKAEMAWRVN